MRCLVFVALGFLWGCHGFDQEYEACRARGACGGDLGGGGATGGGQATGGGGQTTGGGGGGQATGGGGGGGVAATLTVTPDTLSFSQVTLFESATSPQVTVTNTGTSPVSSLSLMLIDDLSGQFSLLMNNCGSTLQGGNLCTVRISFNPTPPLAGTRTARLLVQGGASPVYVTLSGDARAPFTLSPSPVDFAEVNVTNSATRQVTATNNASAAVTPLYLIQPQGQFARGSSCATVPAGQTCQFDVTFSPTDAGIFSANLSAEVVVRGQTFAAPALPLQGTGVALGSLRLSQDPFGGITVDAGTSLFRPFTLTNAGATTLGPISLALTGSSAFSLADAGCAALDAGASCQGLLRFLPAANGSYTGTLGADAGLAGVATTALRANGYAAGQLEFVAGAQSPTPPNPDVIAATNVDVTHTYTLRNASSGSTSAITLFLAGGGASAWRLESPDGGAGQCAPGATLGPSSTCTVSVTFHAGESGNPAGTFTTDLTATATSGGTATHVLTGTAAYSWADGGLWGSTSANVGPPTTACPSRDSFYWEQIAVLPAGLQYQYWHESAFDMAMCAGGWFFQVPAQNHPSRYPGVMRGCGTTVPTWVTGGDHAPATVGQANSYLCAAADTIDPLWADGDLGGVGSCSTNLTYVVRKYSCQ